jgi:hypothetical protein
MGPVERAFFTLLEFSALALFGCMVMLWAGVFGGGI